MIEETHPLIRAARAWHRAAMREQALSFLSSDLAAQLLQYHPLGFIDCVLLSTTDERIQLHIWDDRVSAQQDPPNVCHSHGWHLQSLVLAGEIVNHTYRVLPQFDGDYELYDVSYRHGVSVSHAAGDERVSVALEASHSIRPPDDYEVESSTFHSTSVARYPTATFMIADMRRRVPPRNVRRHGAPKELIYERVSVPPDLGREVVDRVRAAFLSDLLS